MAVYVLVAGSWLGGWCWREVAASLRGRGHDIYPLTLTGLGIGPSSGLNIAAAVTLARALGPGKVVATVAVDTGLKYLAGDLFTGGCHRQSLSPFEPTKC